MNTSRFAPARRQALAGLGAGLAGSAFPALVRAADWKPTRPIRFIVGFSAGGSADTLARLLAEPISKALGTPVVVENIVGAGANIAMAQLARSAPDGLTIGMGSPGTHAINPAMLGSKLPFKVPEDFTPVTLLVTQPNVLIVNNGLGINDLPQFIEWVKAHPDANFGSAGIGTSNQLCGELLSDRLKLKLVHVAYKGAAQVITDLIGGHIPMTFDNITTAAVLAREGKVKAIAVTTAQRSRLLPDVPPLADALPGYDLASWQGLFAPAGLPAPVLEALYLATRQALQDPAVVAKLADLGSVPGGIEPARFAAFTLDEKKRWGDIVRTAKLAAEN